MGLEGEAIYIRLLTWQWVEGSIENDLEVISRRVGVSLAAMTDHWRWIAPCFEPHPTLANRLINPRQEFQRQERLEYKRVQTENGIKGGRPLVKSEAPIVKPTETQTKANDNPTVTQTEPNDNPTVTQTKPGDNLSVSVSVSSNSPNGESAEDRPRTGVRAGDETSSSEIGVQNSGPRIHAVPPPAPAPAHVKGNPRPKPQTFGEFAAEAERLKLSHAGHAITQALAPLVEPYLDGVMSKTKWRKQNNNTARDMAEAGATPEQVVAAWRELQQANGSPYVVLGWLQERMTREKAAKTSNRPNLQVVRVLPEERGFLNGRPHLVKAGTLSPAGFTSVAPRGYPREAERRWIFDGIDIGGWPEYDPRTGEAVRIPA